MEQLNAMWKSKFENGDKVYYVKNYWNNGFGTILFKIFGWYVLKTYPYNKIAISQRLMNLLEIVQHRRDEIAKMDADLNLKLQLLDQWKHASHEILIGEWFLEDYKG